MKLTRPVSAFLLFAAAAALLWWRGRNASASTLSPDMLAQYKDLVSAFKPAAPTIVERSPIDAASEALFGFNALYDQYGAPNRVTVSTADGGFTYAKDMSNVPPAFAQFSARGGNWVGTKPLRITEP